MPLYEYVADSEAGCQHCSQPFETLQGVGEPAVKACPECGTGVRRLLSTFSATASTRVDTSDRNLHNKGFTKYVKRAGGVYERTAGKQGPEVIRKNP